MTTISFSKDKGMLSGVRVYGHSGYSEEGSDIVCAAISSALRLCVCELTDVMGLQAEVIVREEADITVHVCRELSEAQNCLRALYLYLRELSSEFPEYMKLLEV